MMKIKKMPQILFKMYLYTLYSLFNFGIKMKLNNYQIYLNNMGELIIKKFTM